MSRSNPPHRTLKVALIGLVAVLSVVDVVVLAAAPTTSRAELLRLLLAIGAFGVPFLGFLLGFAERPLYAVGGALSLPFVALYAYTGVLLPWTQLSFFLGQFGLELLLSVPVLGEPLATALFGGFTLGQATLQAAFRYHYAIVALAFVGVAAAAGTVGLRRLVSVRSGDSPE
ncbi:cytochrome b N-terminal domain-containing protein [Halobellus ordinarius]|uniref:cytochrome b N-terminal domain-containing protein n=1 Tax=Halobellus ordinarius TaxID=3075120 RepID=UPI0028808D18|nr:cytochrome b N-terminal domain-containing protein [Halobellus sp. ZY16]